jgi:hypothetical protein
MLAKMELRMTLRMAMKNNLRLQKCLCLLMMVVLIGVFSQGTLKAQQVADTEFHYENKNPAFPTNKGPKLLIDKAHSPYVARGAYEPFLKLVREDGFQTNSLETKFTAKSLADTQILVVVNAYKKTFSQFSIMQPPAAHDGDEIEVISDWVSKGGRLLLIADHAPFAGGTIALAEKFGFTYFNGYVLEEAALPFLHGRINYSINNGLNQNHPIVSGKFSQDEISQFFTFGGSAFIPPSDAKSLLTIPKGFVVLLTHSLRQAHSAAKINVSGFSAGSTLTYGDGRIAVFAEAGAFTAQNVDKLKTMGMNNPYGAKNPIFALATMRWLAEGL